MVLYCAHRDRCHSEVEKKLSSFTSIYKIAKEVTLFLTENNYLNQERFANNFARGKFSSNNWGKVKIKIELQKRNIEKHLIDKALEGIDKSEYKKCILIIIQHKMAQYSGSLSEKRNKVYKYLFNRGFEHEAIQSSLKELTG